MPLRGPQPPASQGVRGAVRQPVSQLKVTCSSCSEGGGTWRMQRAVGHHGPSRGATTARPAPPRHAVHLELDHLVAEVAEALSPEPRAKAIGLAAAEVDGRAFGINLNHGRRRQLVV
jgi:enoyl-CoA hydratase/carnithine racemase